MTLRLPNRQHKGIKLLYVQSDSRPGRSHTVQRLRRRGWFCSCEDFQFRRLARRRHCKHIRFARQQQGRERP